MTAITSSGASDTDRARNCTSGWWGRTPSRTARPPPPLRPPRRPRRPPRPIRPAPRPGRRHGPRPGRDAAAPLGTVPTHRPSDDRLPAGHRQLDFGPLAGRRANDRRPPRAGHAGPDGLGDALTILRHRIGVEPVAPVTDEEHDHGGLDLGVE